MKTPAMLLLSALAVCTGYAAGPVVLIVGPPHSGRDTQAALLAKDLGCLLLSADDLIAKNPEKFQKGPSTSTAVEDARLDPSLNEVVGRALRLADLSRGVVLAGYPSTKLQGDFLASLREKYELPRPIVIHLQVPDKVVRERMKDVAGRDVEQELKDYHREFDFATTYFPEADIRTVDGTKKIADVAKEVRKALAHSGK